MSHLCDRIIIAVCIDRAQKLLDMRSMNDAFTRHHPRHSIFKIADDESKTNRSLEKPQGH